MASKQKCCSAEHHFGIEYMHFLEIGRTLKRMLILSIHFTHSHTHTHTHTHASDPKNAKAAALVNTTSESSSGFMLIVSVSFIYARETM